MKVSKYHVNRLLGIAIGMTIVGIISFKTVLTFKFSLVPISGTLNNVKTYVSTVTYKGHQSQRSELVFHIRGHAQQFEIARNIEDKFIDEEYEDWARTIERADSVKVWVRKSEINDYQPQIFQIEADDEILLDHETVRTGPAFLAFFLTILGLGSVLVFAFIKFPDRMRKIFKIDTSTNNRKQSQLTK